MTPGHKIILMFLAGFGAYRLLELVAVLFLHPGKRRDFLAFTTTPPGAFVLLGTALALLGWVLAELLA